MLTAFTFWVMLSIQQQANLLGMKPYAALGATVCAIAVDEDGVYRTRDRIPGILEIPCIFFEHKLPPDCPSVKIRHGMDFRCPAGLPEFLGKVPESSSICYLSFFRANEIQDSKKAILRFTNIRHIEFRECNIDDESFMEIIGKLDQIESINLVGTKLKPSTMACLRKLTKLRSLIVHGATFRKEDPEYLQVNDELISALYAINKLHCLLCFQMNGRRSTSDENIDTLDLSFRHYVTDISMQTIAKVSSLESLNISHLSKLTNRGVASLKPLKKLRKLYIGSNEVIDDDCMSVLSELPNLRLLDLSGTSVSNNGILILANSKSLHSINILFTKVDADGLHEFCTNSRIKEVTVSISDSDNLRIKQLKSLFPNIKFHEQ